MTGSKRKTKCARRELELPTLCLEGRCSVPAELRARTNFGLQISDCGLLMRQRELKFAIRNPQSEIVSRGERI